MSFRGALVNWGSPQDAVRRLADGLNTLADGRSNATGSVTLADGATTTVVTDLRVGTDSVITFMPTTANVAGEIGAGGMYVATVTENGYTITHANNGETDRTFTYSIQG